MALWRFALDPRAFLVFITFYFLLQDIVQYSYLLRGGHFLAFEEPKLLAEDFFSFVRKLEERDKIKY